MLGSRARLLVLLVAAATMLLVAGCAGVTTTPAGLASGLQLLGGFESSSGVCCTFGSSDTSTTASARLFIVTWHGYDGSSGFDGGHSVAIAASVAAEGGSEVLLDTSAVKARGAARALLGDGETPVICSTVACEAAQQGFDAGGLSIVPDGVSAVLRGRVATALRAFGASAQGFANDATIGATALERGSPLITGDRALYNAVRSLGGDARLIRPGG